MSPTPPVDIATSVLAFKGGMCPLLEGTSVYPGLVLVTNGTKNSFYAGENTGKGAQ